MPAVYREQPAWRTAVHRVAGLGLFTLLLLPGPAPGQSAGPPAARPPVRAFHHNLSVKPAAWGRFLWPCPLPPGSAFHLQTHLRRYLETWPTPGSTAAEAWPEYVAEAGEGVD